VPDKDRLQQGGTKGRHLTCGFIPLVSGTAINLGCKQKENITLSSEHNAGTDFGFITNHGHLCLATKKSSFSLLHIHKSSHTHTYIEFCAMGICKVFGICHEHGFISSIKHLNNLF
jgi:hypothetical protein